MTETLMNIEVNPENAWRLETPGSEGWARDVRVNSAKKKYYMISCDTHLNPPSNLFRERLDKKWHDMLPRVEVRENGRKYVIVAGMDDTPLVDSELAGEDLVRTRSGAAPMGQSRDDTLNGQMNSGRIADQKRDGVDGEVIFPNGFALFLWASRELEFVKAQCRAWNDWTAEACLQFGDFCNPAAALFPLDVEDSVREVERVAKLGFRTVTMPCKPVFGDSRPDHPNYNLPMYDPLWAAIQDHDLAITYHVATTRDPRGTKGPGGAITNYVVHALSPTMEPIVNMCSSGVFERFPKLRAATIEANAGWVPWMIQAMDEAYKKHHMWVRPKLKALPGDYYRSNCFASVGEDDAALILCEEFGLQDNLMWANDYPHHEGSWPHSAESIERTFRDRVSEETRAKILGLNAARCFRFKVPEEYK